MTKPFIPEILPLKNLNWSKLISFIGPANAALARYDGILEGILNPNVLLTPLTTQEAVLSSRIEGTISTLEEVLEYDVSRRAKEGRENDIQEVLNYREAMWHSVQELKKRPTSLNLILKLHSILLDSVRGRDKGRGQFRMIQNWIGTPGTPIDKAKYIPPPPQGISKYLDNLEKYIHYSDSDSLVQLAIIHAQFELIHPFIDGNGRLGRMLIPLLLYERKMLSKPTFYLSSYLEAHRDQYYSALLSVSSENNWEGWIAFFLNAIIAQAKENIKKAKNMLGLYEKKKVKLSNLTRSQFAIQATDTIFKFPIFRTTDFIRNSKIPKQSAMRILKKLQDAKVLRVLEASSGKRPAILMFSKLISIVEDREFE